VILLRGVVFSTDRLEVRARLRPSFRLAVCGQGNGVGKWSYRRAAADNRRTPFAGTAVLLSVQLGFLLVAFGGTHRPRGGTVYRGDWKNTA
jgi:hypothetical protein